MIYYSHNLTKICKKKTFTKLIINFKRYKIKTFLIRIKFGPYFLQYRVFFFIFTNKQFIQGTVSFLIFRVKCRTIYNDDLTIEKSF